VKVRHGHSPEDRYLVAVSVLAGITRIGVPAGAAVNLAPALGAVGYLTGDNTYAQVMGDGHNYFEPVAQAVGVGATWARVAAGDVHTVAIRSDGTLWAWGGNYLGQLGNSTTVDRSSPVPDRRRDEVGKRRRRAQPHGRGPNRRHAVDLGIQHRGAAR
jgi:hypothetical protein